MVGAVGARLKKALDLQRGEAGLHDRAARTIQRHAGRKVLSLTLTLALTLALALARALALALALALTLGLTPTLTRCSACVSSTCAQR